jgi:protein tyrosine/serine phosphatase
LKAAAQTPAAPAEDYLAAPSSASALTPPVERLDMPGLPNLAHVEKGIYRGGRPQLDGAGMASLQKLGIKEIIDLQGGDLTSPSKSDWPDWTKLILRLEPGEAPSAIEAEADAASAAGIAEASIPLDSLDPVTAQEAGSLDEILGLLAASSAQAPVYVHCEHGKDRTGLVIALYRMRYDGWTQEQAAAEMVAMGHSGMLDKLSTRNMDLRHVLPLFPELAAPLPAGDQR